MVEHVLAKDGIGVRFPVSAHEIQKGRDKRPFCISGERRGIECEHWGPVRRRGCASRAERSFGSTEPKRALGRDPYPPDVRTLYE